MAVEARDTLEETTFKDPQDPLLSQKAAAALQSSPNAQQVEKGICKELFVESIH